MPVLKEFDYQFIAAYSRVADSPQMIQSLFVFEIFTGKDYPSQMAFNLPSPLLKSRAIFFLMTPKSLMIFMG